MMYQNQCRDRESLYDYQKIQSTAQGSQFLGQRHYILGGPTSGYDQMLVAALHISAKTFDETRGASVHLNSYNHLN